MTRASDTAKLLGAGGSILGSLDIGGGQIGGRRNIIINGAMKVAQRGTSSTGLGATSGYYTLDRNRLTFSGTAGRLTMTQTADGPSGFANCLKLDCTTADTSIAAGEILILGQNFEGQDLQQFKKGTSDAEKITVSFYVKGNANATYTCELYDNDNSRSIAQEFSVTTSWSRVVLTFNNETSNALDDDNASSLSLHLWLHGGSTFAGGTFASNTWHTTNANRLSDSQSSFFDSTDRTFFITGVQMEVGSVATPFEHRSFGEEFDLCLRYYEKSSAYGVAEDSTAGANIYGVVGMAGSASSVGNNDATMIHWQKSKRVAPTLVFYDAAGNSGKLSYAEAGVGRADNIAIRSSNIGVNRSRIGTAGASGLDAGEAVEMLFQYTADSEL
jgi:hypothetical protein